MLGIELFVKGNLIVHSLFVLILYSQQILNLHHLIQQQGLKLKRQSMSEGLQTIFRIVDTNLANFYSSRPHRQPDQRNCACKLNKMDRAEQIGFYSSQKSMISSAADSLTESKKDDERMVGRILHLMVDYTSKILQLLHQDIICECIRRTVSQSVVTKHKLNFLREENDKLFKIYTQKSNECDSLKLQIQSFARESDLDVRPLTSRPYESKQNKQNLEALSIGFPSSVHLCEEKSIRSSKISDYGDHGPTDVKEMLQKNHNQYFMASRNKNTKKSKIFNDPRKEESQFNLLK